MRKRLDEELTIKSISIRFDRVRAIGLGAAQMYSIVGLWIGTDATQYEFERDNA